MEKSIDKKRENFLKSSTLIRMSGNAFRMMKEGREQEARAEFPMEYHFIKKYLPASLDELTSLLSSKLQLH